MQQRDRYLRAQELLQPRLAANARKPPSERLPAERVVISPSDPEAPLGLDKFKTFRPLYDTLFLTDRHSLLIVSYDVFAQSQDTACLVPILERMRELTGRLPERAALDAGFITALNLAHAEKLGVKLIGPWKENDFSSRRAAKNTAQPAAKNTAQPAAKNTVLQFSKDRFVWHADENAYECPAGARLLRIGSETRTRAGDQQERLDRYGAPAETCAACTLRPRCTNSRSGRQLRRSEHEELIVAHRAHMQQPAAKEFLKARGQIAERAFADLKEHRHLRRHTGRGRARAQIDIGLATLVHNLQLVHRYTTNAQK